MCAVAELGAKHSQLPASKRLFDDVHLACCQQGTLSFDHQAPFVLQAVCTRCGTAAAAVAAAAVTAATAVPTLCVFLVF